uniref:Uncharacterized protein n=1 Tax=Nyssomyia neivai TaxID=330878 RepID=A0A1L8D7Z9_9DIPT
MLMFIRKSRKIWLLKRISLHFINILMKLRNFGMENIRNYLFFNCYTSFTQVNQQKLIRVKQKQTEILIKFVFKFDAYKNSH